uniref:Uncharacterized protein n=1 Tax=Salix viminalis TaxID=40686 RepID=A0A6N2NM85_SALVM
MWKSTAQIISQGRESILASDHDRDLLLSNTDTNRSSLGKQYSRFDAQVRALQCDFDTYCSEPEDKEDYEKWKSRGFVIDEEEEEIERLITEMGMFKLNQAEEARALLVKRAISGDEEEDLSWDFDDDKEEGDGCCRKERAGVDGSEDKLEEKAIVGLIQVRKDGEKGDNGESCKDSDKLEETVVEGKGDNGESCKDSDKLEETVVEGKGDTGESCKDSDKLEETVVGKGG